MKPKFLQLLDNRKESGSYRSLSLFQDFVDFFSNDYLGLSSKLKIESQKFTRLGSSGSRLISGNSSEAEGCERFLADFFQSEAALVFNSGYDANIGLFPPFLKKAILSFMMRSFMRLFVMGFV